VNEQTPAATVPVQLRLMSVANGPQLDNLLKNGVDQARVAGVISQQLRNSNFENKKKQTEDDDVKR